MTTRVFLVVPDGFRAVLCSNALFLCRVVLWKEGRTSCAILSYISTCAFRVTLGRRAPFDTSSWAIWPDKEILPEHDP